VTRPPRPSDEGLAQLVGQASRRVQSLSMIRIYRMVFELCWHQPSVVIAVLDSLDAREWDRAPSGDPG
jgi:hypothetical protein